MLDMCMMCEGADLDDVRWHVHGLIERCGWAVVPVEDRGRLHPIRNPGS